MHIQSKNGNSKFKKFRIRSGCILPDSSRCFEFDKTFPIYAIGGGLLEAKSVASKVASDDKSNAPLRVFVEIEEMEGAGATA